MTEPTIQYRKAVLTDFEGILLLQHQNLLTTLQGEDLAQGFLSIEYTCRYQDLCETFNGQRESSTISYIADLPSRRNNLIDSSCRLCK